MGTPRSGGLSPDSLCFVSVRDPPLPSDLALPVAWLGRVWDVANLNSRSGMN